ncbi:chemotaxis protein CheW [Vreelandella utahensis]|uniref:chemotaxis protein CheW n=1 Tax=Vreelandella halophila TaxID=86177 RepID=UPI0009873C8E|nr:chemotaxis protein CheW [Halomonas utahensis]
MAENPEQLSCVLIPVQDTTLLLPNVSIAEIVDYEPDPADEDQEWVLGRLQWRGVNLPVLSWEAANGGDPFPPEGRRGRILVLNTITERHEAMPFMAMATRGIPRQAKVSPEELRREPDADGDATLMTVIFEGEHCVIPDMAVLEDLAQRAAG